MVSPIAFLLVAVGLPWLIAVATLAIGSRPRLREAVAVGGGFVLLGAVWGLVPGALAGEPATFHVATIASGLALAFRADAAGVLFALLVAVLWPLASLYSSGYLAKTDARSETRFFAAYAASIAAVVGLAFAANLLTLFVAYELLTVATYPLVVHPETDQARQAGRKYIAYTLGGGVAVLAGTLLVNAMVGPVGFTPGGMAGIVAADPILARVAFALLVTGFGVKAALMPLHGWLPDAMVAPTPVSALLHAVAVVKSGVFGIVRVVLYVFGPDGVSALEVGTALAVVGTVTMVLAGLLALRQDRLKRGLAYSTVSQLSYIVVGLAVLTPMAVHGALLHLTTHAFMKIALFLCAGVIYAETHVVRIDDLDGIARRLPLTMTLFAVASAGLVGLPLVAGFVSKWYLLAGLLGGGHLVFAGALLVAGLLKLLFFWPIVSGAFFGRAGAANPAAGALHADGGQPADHAGGGWDLRSWRTETDWRLLIPVAVAVAIAVVYGVVPTELSFFELAARVVEVTGG